MSRTITMHYPNYEDRPISTDMAHLVALIQVLSSMSTHGARWRALHYATDWLKEMITTEQRGAAQLEDE